MIDYAYWVSELAPSHVAFLAPDNHEANVMADEFRELGLPGWVRPVSSTRVFEKAGRKVAFLRLQSTTDAEAIAQRYSRFEMVGDISDHLDRLLRKLLNYGLVVRDATRVSTVVHLLDERLT